MISQRGFIVPVLLVIFVALIAGGLYLLTRQNTSSQQPQNSIASQKTTSKTSATSSSAGTAAFGSPECHQNDKYFVIEQNHTGDVGTDHLIKMKATPDQQFECTYSMGPNDFEIKNEWAEYFLALEGNFLILDSGTGPYPRSFIVYDLEKKAKVFSDAYLAPISINNGTIDYWTVTTQVATTANCPNFEQYEKSGLGAGIDEHVLLDLSKLTKKDLGEQRCDSRQ